MHLWFKQIYLYKYIYSIYGNPCNLLEPIQLYAGQPFWMGPIPPTPNPPNTKGDRQSIQHVTQTRRTSLTQCRPGPRIHSEPLAPAGAVGALVAPADPALRAAAHVVQRQPLLAVHHLPGGHSHWVTPNYKTKKWGGGGGSCLVLAGIACCLIWKQQHICGVSSFETNLDGFNKLNEL